ncbi:rod shape-determining protein MreD [Lactobacillus hamsteri]|uniref:Cell shape determining protein n=1 Tax=Lactobacillus hamsteri DSM 5661 = JCM 6256 TaxID=1423754 RepID=A0A0R1Y5F7_9LACO|nr:rod shape-determining protein MreD [Lactobacillus hamsteri]KRM37229.1 cell shape determining protein [Lactobacillus hamsteri DSM 5661 = JCM 6256]
MRVFRKWVLAIALFVALILDGTLAFYLHQFMNIGAYGASTWILPIGIMLIGLFDDTNPNEIWLALGAGIVADISTLGIIGVYTVFFPVSCWACQRVARFLPEIFWSRLIVVIIGVTILDIYSWAILTMVGIISVSIKIMLISLAVNACWTIIFFSITYWIWGNLAENYPFLIDLRAYR